MSFTYDDVGATRKQGFCPPGFHPLHVRTRLGEGQEVFRALAERFAELRLETKELEYSPSVQFRSLTSLPVAWD